MNLVSWNIQSGRGVDGEVRLARIAEVISAIPFPNGGPADVICLQEVARFFSGVTGGVLTDQVAELRELFCDYVLVFRPAVDVHFAGAAGVDRIQRRQFGCMMLSRYPVLQVCNHMLTRKGTVAKGMQRQLLEAVVEGPHGPLRVMTTHLEFNSRPCRMAQVRQIRTLHEEVGMLARLTSPAGSSDGPYFIPHPPREAVLCGDFNFTPDSEEYLEVIAPLHGAGPDWADAWVSLHGGTAHKPSCGMEDAVQWPQGPHCRDFFFATPGLLKKASMIDVDIDTRASDHQPIFLSFDFSSRRHI